MERPGLHVCAKMRTAPPAAVMAACEPSARRQRLCQSSVRPPLPAPLRALHPAIGSRRTALRDAPRGASMPLPLARQPSGLERQPAVWRTRASLLVALLALTFVLAAVLAYEAHDAAQSHRVTAARALRDYATFAAWELLANATDTVAPTVSAALAPVTSGAAATPYEALPGPALLKASAGGALRCAAQRDDDARWYFRLDFRDGSFTTDGASPSADERLLVRSTIDREARTVYRPDWSYATVLVGRAPADRAVAYGVKYAVHGAPIAAFGFVTCANALGAPVFAGIMGHHPLLPRTLAGHEPNDSLVTVTVFGPSGDTLWQSGRRSLTPFTADATL